jgi:hypothetical protein
MNDSPPETRASLLVKLRDHQNASAWQDFTDLYTPVIRKTALRMGLQVADVENVVQEVLLAVSQSIDQWLANPLRGSFRGWLSRIAKNKTLDLLTRKATRPESGPSREWDAIPAALSSLSSYWDQEYRCLACASHGAELFGAIRFPRCFRLESQSSRGFFTKRNIGPRARRSARQSARQSTRSLAVRRATASTARGTSLATAQ